MDPFAIKHWLDVVQGTLTIAATAIGGFWAWSRFVVERGLIPLSQLDVELRSIGSSEVAVIVEVTARIQNKGSSALVVTDLKVRLRYLREVFRSPTNGFGPLRYRSTAIAWAVPALGQKP